MTLAFADRPGNDTVLRAFMRTDDVARAVSR